MNKTIQRLALHVEVITSAVFSSAVKTSDTTSEENLHRSTKMHSRVFASVYFKWVLEPVLGNQLSLWRWHLLQYLELVYYYPAILTTNLSFQVLRTRCYMHYATDFNYTLSLFSPYKMVMVASWAASILWVKKTSIAGSLPMSVTIEVENG